MFIVTYAYNPTSEEEHHTTPNPYCSPPLTEEELDNQLTYALEELYPAEEGWIVFEYAVVDNAVEFIKWFDRVSKEYAVV